MKTGKIATKYTPNELADSFVFRTKLTSKEKKESDKQLSEMRKKAQKNITTKQLLLSRIMQLKFQIEDYLNNASYDSNRSFVFFLKEYLRSLNKKNKDFASDLDIDETELSQILNRHRTPSEKLMIRLEIHSGKAIPAITWYRLLKKEKEYELLTDTVTRRNESKHVKNRLQLSI